MYGNTVFDTVYGNFGVVIPSMFLVPSAPPQNLTLEVRNSKVRCGESPLCNG